MNQFRDQDDVPEYRYSHVFPPDAHDQGHDGYEDCRADPTLAKRIEHSFLHERVEAHRDRDPQDGEGEECPPIEKRDQSHEEYPADVDQAIEGDDRAGRGLDSGAFSGPIAIVRAGSTSAVRLPLGDQRPLASRQLERDPSEERP